MRKIVRTSTVPLSLNILLKGQLKFLNQYFLVKAISSEGDDLESVSKREGVDTIVVNMQRGISPFKDLISLIELYKKLRREKPLIIHSITPKAGLLTMLAGKFARIPIRLHTFTGLIFPTAAGFKKRILIAMDRLLCWSATNIYPEGEGVKNDLLKYNITRKPLKILANGNVNGIDTSYFNPELYDAAKKQKLRNELSIHSDDFVFIFVGRLVGDKGINELVQAFSNSKFKIQNSKLLLVGSLETELDPLSAETLKEIQENANIISVGFQPDVRPYFAISNALAFPSYREGFPNVVMQAGAMGLPSIVTDINGCNEIIEEGKNGLIIPPKEVVALQKAMERLKTDNDLYNYLQQHARELIVNRYQREEVWQALLEEYQILLQEKGFSFLEN